MGSELIPLVTGSGGALVVLLALVIAIVRGDFVSGKTHEATAKRAELAESEAERLAGKLEESDRIKGDLKSELSAATTEIRYLKEQAERQTRVIEGQTSEITGLKGQISAFQDVLRENTRAVRAEAQEQAARDLEGERGA